MNMKNFHSIIAMFLMLIAITTTSKASSWRVNNFAQSPYGVNMGGTASHPVFTQLEDAVYSPLIEDGDTLYLEASPDIYEGASINKRLTIIGVGFFLNENHGNSINDYTSEIGSIYFYSGAENSKLVGLYISEYSGIEIDVSNITINRCKINYDIMLNNSISNIYILGNIFPDTETSTSIIDASYSGFPVNVRFNNNICQRKIDLEYDDPDYQFEQCNNNVFDIESTADYEIFCYAASFKNNIITNSTTTVYINGVDDFDSYPDPSVAYNISVNSSIQFGSDYSNIEVADMDDLFVDPTSNTTDGDYQLLAGSPGSSNGSDGTDRGAFGGNIANRYVLSGLAPVPVIYEISTTGIATEDGMLPVTIKAKIVE